MSDDHDSWFSSIGVDIGKLRDKGAALVQNVESEAKTWVDQKVEDVKSTAQNAENWAKQEYDAGKKFVAEEADDAKKWLNQKKDDVDKEIGAVKQTVVGDQSNKPVPRPMEQDCKPVHGKVPGPKNHLYCGTHGHVLDTDSGQIIAASIAAYVKSGLAKAAASIDPSMVKADIGRSGPLNSPSYVNNQDPSANLLGGDTASAGDSYFVTGGQKGELVDRVKGLIEVGKQMNEMAKMLEKKGTGIIFDDKSMLASAKNMLGAAKATLTLAKEIDKWSNSENAASIEKGSAAVDQASKLIKAVETVSKLRDTHLALEKMEEKTNQQSVEAWADSVGDAFAAAGEIIPTSGLPGFMGDYYKGLFQAPKNYISAFKTMMHVHYDKIDTESGLTGETLLHDATRKAVDLGDTGLNWSGDLTGVFVGGWTLPKTRDGTGFQNYMIKHKTIAGTNMLKTTVQIGIALLSSSIETELDDEDAAKRAWLTYLGNAH